MIGVPSAGKTTLATELAQRLDVPVYALDQLAFVDDRWTLRAESERDEMLARILEDPGFVTEGGFLGWTTRSSRRPTSSCGSIRRSARSSGDTSAASGATRCGFRGCSGSRSRATSARKARGPPRTTRTRRVPDTRELYSLGATRCSACVEVSQPITSWLVSRSSTSASWLAPALRAAADRLRDQVPVGLDQVVNHIDDVVRRQGRGRVRIQQRRVIDVLA
jgi:hypothetical protein